MEKFIFTTTSVLEGIRILEYKDVVNVNMVIGINLLADYIASVTDVLGGTSETYRRRMDMMYNEIKREMQEKAMCLGANAIVGFTMDFDEISGKGKSMFMVSASGTACTVEHQIGSTVTDNKIITCDTLGMIISMENIAKKINNGQSLAENEWEMVYDTADSKLLEPMIRYYYLKHKTFNHVNRFIRTLPLDDIIPIIYSVYEDTYGSACYVDGNLSTCGILMLKLMRELHIFDPEKILLLFDKNQQAAISALSVDKVYYTKEDLKRMKIIIDKYENLPDVGERTVGKTGIFAKEKNIWICPEGHKNDTDTEFCTICRKNIKGLTQENIQNFEAFKHKFEVLEGLLQ